jgi:hypothetical protein
LTYEQSGEPRQHVFVASPGRLSRVTLPEDDTPSSDAADDDAWQRYLGLGAIGLGAVGISVGVVQGLEALSIKERLDRDCPDDECPSGARKDIREFERARSVSTVGYVVGAASLATGGVILWKSATGPSVELQAGFRQAWLRGQF